MSNGKRFAGSFQGQDFFEGDVVRTSDLKLEKKIEWSEKDFGWGTLYQLARYAEKTGCALNKVEPLTLPPENKSTDPVRLIDLGTRKYTRVFSRDEKKFGAYHYYVVESVNENGLLSSIQFQCGPIKEFGVNGVMNEDLIVMVIDRLIHFQETEFKCRENALALTKLEEALMWLRKRTEERERRNVEGTHRV